ncbi:hypothetical protein GCM10010361_10820 [Streptomyces olivaceiscleroticus]|uniref:Uncharacterized protein n=1 Tax=Streptomyces olivaceiscleroticus TaxID=68245 RepID=A0ABN0ZI97_9ACTN
MLDEDILGGPAGLVMDVERVHDGVRDERAALDAGQRHHPDATTEGTLDLLRQVLSEAGFADPTRTDQCQQSGSGQEPPGLRQLTSTADKTGCFRGKADSVSGPRSTHARSRPHECRDVPVSSREASASGPHEAAQSGE